MKRNLHARLTVLALVLLVAGCGGNKPSEDVKLGGIALTDVLDGLMVRTKQALAGIRSMETAQASVPRLVEINDDFEDLRYHAPKLSPAGQDELAKSARKHQPEVVAMVRAVRDSPALYDIMGEEMEKMLGQLNWLMAPPFAAEE